jgi:hypothetical protein
MEPAGINSYDYLDKFEFWHIEQINELSALEELKKNIHSHRENLKSCDFEAEILQFLDLKANTIISKINSKQKIFTPVKTPQEIIAPFFSKSIFGFSDVDVMLYAISQMQVVLFQVQSEEGFNALEEAMQTTTKTIETLKNEPAQITPLELTNLVSHLETLNQKARLFGEHILTLPEDYQICADDSGLTINIGAWKKTILDPFLKELENKISKLKL